MTFPIRYAVGDWSAALTRACGVFLVGSLTEVQSIPKEQLHRTEGTVLLHISFAIKQDQDLAREFIKYIKVRHRAWCMPVTWSGCGR